MVHSETETDSEGGCSLPNSPAFHSSTLHAPSAKNVAKAIQELHTLTPHTSEKDFVGVSEASFEIILEFIHTSTPLGPEMISTLAKLHPVFMRHIFDIRCRIRKLVAAQSRRGPVATCVDVLLAKLHSLIGDLVSNARVSTTSPTPKTMLHRTAEENSVRGTTQLSDGWEEVPCVLQSSYHSQAAKRVGLTILFGAYVVFPRLCDAKFDTMLKSEWSALWDSLMTSLRQRQSSKNVPSAACHFLEDRIYAAMTVALLAESFRRGNPPATSVELRPNQFGRILDIVADILCSNQSFLLEIDNTQSVLLHWSSFVPWSWSVWQDPRCAGTELLFPLSLTWFYHLGSFPIAAYGPQSRMYEIYAGLLTEAPSHSFKMISLLLREICFAELWASTTRVPQLLTLVGNVCWGILQLMEHLARLPDQKSTEWSSSLVGTIQAVIWIFPRIALSEGMKAAAVQQLLIEILASVESDFVVKGLSAIKEDKGDFVSGISRVLALSGERSDLRPTATQTLQFLVVLASRCNGLEWLRDLTRTEVKAASDALGKEDGKCPVTLNIALVAGCLGLGDFDGLIWSKVGNQSRTDIVTTVNLAEHILLRSVPSDALICCDAWDRLRDGLIQIVNRTVPESDESIAVLGSASICDAMRAIIRANQVARAMVSSSPWNITLATGVERGIGLVGNDVYASMLRKMLGNSAKELVRETCGIGRPSEPIEKNIKNRQLGYLNGQLVMVPSRGLF